LSTRSYVPAAPFAPLIEARIQDLSLRGVQDPIEDVARETGVAQRIIWGVRNGSQQNLDFRNADKIVTKLAGPMLWHTDPVLNEIYLNVDLPDIATNGKAHSRHGMRSMYSNHGCRCAPCTKANSDYLKQKKVAA
jgi:hypothetical protein